jgi:hypothetical protein
VRITKVELCDHQHQPRTTFQNGDPLAICLHYVAEIPVERPVFGFAIYHQNGTHVCGPNTKFDELPVPRIQGAGVIRYTIPALPLLEGGYTLSVAVVNDADTETYDYHDRLYDFHVYRGKAKEQYGLISLNGRWTREGAPPLGALPALAGHWEPQHVG